MCGVSFGVSLAPRPWTSIIPRTIIVLCVVYQGPVLYRVRDHAVLYCVLCTRDHAVLCCVLCTRDQHCTVHCVPGTSIVLCVLYQLGQVLYCLLGTRDQHCTVCWVPGTIINYTMCCVPETMQYCTVDCV